MLSATVCLIRPFLRSIARLQIGCPHVKKSILQCACNQGGLKMVAPKAPPIWHMVSTVDLTSSLSVEDKACIHIDAL